MKKNHFALMISLFITVSCLIAQNTRADYELTTSQLGTLFKISKNGQNDSYLYAISHSASASTTKISPKINEILDEVEALAMELKMDDPNLQQNMMNHIAMNNGQKLSTIYTTEQFTEVNDFFVKNLGAKLSNFETFKPMALQSYLLPSFLGHQIFSFETVLITAAAQKEKPLLGLETVEKQLAALDALDYTKQAELLYKMVKNDTVLKQNYMSINEAYELGNMNKVYKVTQSVLGSQGFNVIFDERNKEFIKNINEITDKQSILIALGAGHFGGSNGLLKLLEKEGFSISVIN